MDFFNTILRPRGKVRREHCELSSTKESSNEQIEDQINADLFFIFRKRQIVLFPKLKNVLKGRHFRILENIQKSVMNMLKTIPVEDFQHCYKKWERFHRCVAFQGNYFEGNNIDV